MNAIAAVDWGTTRRRAWLVDAEGRILDRRADDQGMMSIPSGNWPAALGALLVGWPADIPVVMAGMVGAKQGWIETPYLDCPADEVHLAASLVAVPERARTFIVPGLRTSDDTGAVDVLRGEEVQVFGAARSHGATGLIVLPGTHSKWVRLDGESITTFRTYFTGELWNILLAHSSIGRAATGTAHDATAFAAGVDRAGRRDTLGRLFGARAAVVGDGLDAASVPSFLSGLLIGQEVFDATRDIETDIGLTIIGRTDLASLYRQVCTQRGIAVDQIDEECACTGLLAIARARGLAT